MIRVRIIAATESGKWKSLDSLLCPLTIACVHDVIAEDYADQWKTAIAELSELGQTALAVDLKTGVTKIVVGLSVTDIRKLIEDDIASMAPVIAPEVKSFRARLADLFKVKHGG